MAYVTFTHLFNVPHYYHPDQQVYTCTADSVFKNTVNQWISDVNSFRPSAWGAVTYSSHIGWLVNKPNSFHNSGRAFDLSALTFANGVSIRPADYHHSNASRTIRRRYVGLDARCRRFFKYVLDGWYDSAHGNHIHVDNGGGAIVLNKSLTSDVKFVQAAINNLMDGYNLAVDGVWGSATDAAFRVSKTRAGVTGDTSSSTAAWKLWLHVIASRAWADQSL